MKKVRLEFPLFWEEPTGDSARTCVYLKVSGNRTEVFADRECTQPLPLTDNLVSLEMQIPEELHIIEVVPPNGHSSADTSKVDLIWFGWESDEKTPWALEVYFTISQTLGVFHWNCKDVDLNF